MSRFTKCNYVKPATDKNVHPMPEVRQRKSMAMGQADQNAKVPVTPMKKSPGKTM